MLMLSISILGFLEKSTLDKRDIKKIDSQDFEYIHLDIMNQDFVSKNSKENNQIKEYLQEINHPLDIHLMVGDIIQYIDVYQDLNPTYITFHIEATKNPMYIIEYIRKKNIKVGIAINPKTDIEKIQPYLNMIDLVLVMSVEPGYGNQKFIDICSKIKKLIQIRKEYNHSFLIEVDGGIDNQTAPLVQQADIVVVGSYITSKENYKMAIHQIKDSLK